MGKATGILGLCLVLLGPSSPALGQGSFGAKDIGTITKTSRTNELRFKRDYKGKPFQATLPVNTISENFLLKTDIRPLLVRTY